MGDIVAGNAAAIVEACRERGLVVLSAGDDVVRLAPPLTIGTDDVEEALSVLTAALASLESGAKLQVVT